VMPSLCVRQYAAPPSHRPVSDFLKEEYRRDPGPLTTRLFALQSCRLQAGGDHTFAVILGRTQELAVDRQIRCLVAG
jgi:hypothetical protein